MGLKVSNRDELRRLSGDIPEVKHLQTANKNHHEQAPDFSTVISVLSEAVQQNYILSTKSAQAILALAKSLADRTEKIESAMKATIGKTLIADIERDSNDKMKRVIIKVS